MPKEKKETHDEARKRLEKEHAEAGVPAHLSRAKISQWLDEHKADFEEEND